MTTYSAYPTYLEEGEAWSNLLEILFGNLAGLSSFTTTTNSVDIRKIDCVALPWTTHTWLVTVHTTKRSGNLPAARLPIPAF